MQFFLDVVADIFPETADDEDEDDEFLRSTRSQR